LSRRFNRTTVGSIKGHVSRNFLVGRNGHVFVPKVDLNTDKSTLVNLMEYDTELKLVDTHPIEHYRSDQRFMGHGIIAYSHMKNGDIYFTTSVGALYKLSMLSNSKHNLEFISFIDEANQPGGYFPSMFSLDGTDFLVGLGRIPNKPTYSWFIYNISSETLVTYQIKELDGHFLLYGSLTRDNNGNLYVVGVDRTDKQKHVPQVLQLSYPNAPMTR